MQILVPLAGLLAAGGVWLVLSPLAWQRLVGIALLGQALPLLFLAAGGLTPHAIVAGLIVALIAFAWFLAECGKPRAASAEETPPSGEGA